MQKCNIVQQKVIEFLEGEWRQKKKKSVAVPKISIQIYIFQIKFEWEKSVEEKRLTVKLALYLLPKSKMNRL